MSDKSMSMKGNLGKTILQIGATFGDPASAVWEYVSNALDYREHPDGCKIYITTSTQKIVISDNSSGMDEKVLKNFFTVSGENLARQGKQSSWLKRGINGTGKLAVFGIADELIVETNHEGIKNSYKISRKALESSPEDANEIPVDTIVINEKTKEKNGTTITLNKLNIKVKPEQLINKIQREIAFMRDHDIQIAVNSHLCEFKELDIVSSHTFQSDGPIKERYGDFELRIDVSRVPLDSMDKGIKILCNKTLVGLEDCAIGSKECGNLLCGHVDIPSLEDPIDNIKPFDQSRNQKLNKEHKGVHELLLFIAPKLEKVRKEESEKKEEERNTLQSQKLSAMTNDLSKKLNKEFNNFQKLLSDVRVGSNAKSAISFFNEPGNDDEIESFSDGEGVFVGDEEEIRTGMASDSPKEPENESQKIFEESELSDKEASKGPGKKSKRRRAGFMIEHQRLGEDEQRSIYDQDELKIIVNLDHPTVVSCLRSCSGDVENSIFKRLNFEIVMREFEHAVAEEMIADNDMYSPHDLLYDMRLHFDRISRVIGIDVYGN